MFTVFAVAAIAAAILVLAFLMPGFGIAAFFLSLIAPARLKPILLAVAMILLMPLMVSAADGTTVSVPYGDWIGQILGDAAAVLSVVLLGIVTRFLPATLKAWLTAQRTAQVEQLLERAIGFAAQRIIDVTKGKALTVDVKNNLVAQAVQYVIDHGPAKLIEWMGGKTAIEQKVLARLPTSPSAAAVVTPPAAMTP